MSDDLSPTSIITLIEKQKRTKHRYNIYIDDKYAFSVHEDVLVKHRLTKSEAIELDRMQLIVQDEERHQAYLQAIRYLSRKARASKELAAKLLDKDYNQETVDFVMQKLSEQGYIDDQQFASMLTQQRVHSQKRGSRWIKQELTAKGLSKEHIDGAMAQIDEETEFQSAYDIAEKRWHRLHADDHVVRKRKISGFLLRRGYSYTIVNGVLRRLEDGHEATLDEFNEDELN